ncbi:crumbs protein precursor 95F [Gracilaria domingensis]|nr:crumbs protein precursor 95F [Gracilaria domingensis]
MGCARRLPEACAHRTRCVLTEQCVQDVIARSDAWFRSKLEGDVGRMRTRCALQDSAAIEECVTLLTTETARQRDLCVFLELFAPGRARRRGASDRGLPGKRAGAARTGFAKRDCNARSTCAKLRAEDCVAGQPFVKMELFALEVMQRSDAWCRGNPEDGAERTRTGCVRQD